MDTLITAIVALLAYLITNILSNTQLAKKVQSLTETLENTITLQIDMLDKLTSLQEEFTKHTNNHSLHNFLSTELDTNETMDD